MSAEALLRAVLADPDDDAPRLIYADWLDENGDPDRAEFIRVQVALAGSDKNDPHNPQLWERQRALLVAHEKRWAAALEGVALRWTFRRGFVEEVEVAAPVFLRLGDRLFETAPVQTVKLVRAGLSGPRLAACPALKQVVNLDLSGSHLWASHLAILLASPFLVGLRGLSLAHNHLGRTGAAVLATVPLLGWLRRLELRENRLHDAGAILLGGCPRMARLQVLGLRSNGIGGGGANALIASPHLDSLTLLDLRDNYTDSAAPALRERFGERVRL
jgi:uncharacterized protein (TIGR02996 family)